MAAAMGRWTPTRRGVVSARFRGPLLILLLGVGVLPWSRTQLVTSNELHTAIMVLSLAATALTALLLAGEFRSDGALRRLLWAIAFAWTAGLIAVYSVAFPGVLHVDLQVGVGQGAAWLWALYHSTFPLLLSLAAVLLQGDRHRTVPWAARRRYVWIGVAGASVLAVVLATTLVVFDNHLPVVVIGRNFDPLVRLVGPPVVVSVAAALVLSYFARGPLSQWLPSICAVALVDVVLTLHAGQRFTVGWYVGRVLFLVAVSILLVRLLSQILNAFAQLVDLTATLEDAAYTDPLTGLPNRRILERLDVPRDPKVVAVIDVDHFKAINDQYGHDAGDVVLHAVAGRLRRRLPSDDLLIRWGGDEIVAVLNLGIEQARPVLDRLRRGIEENPVRTGKGFITVTVTVGAAPWRTNQSLDVALAEADESLYEAKRAGRNQVALPSSTAA